MTPAPDPPMLSPAELARYGRQLLLPQVGEAGQGRLARARVLVVGAGGLGSPAALYLAAAGVGRLGVVDADAVELSNLHRQLLHGTADVGRPKVESAAARLRDLNPEVAVVPIEARLDATNAAALLRDWDVVVDGSDNFPTRYLVNDACVRLGVPTVHGSVARFAGQVAVFGVGEGPCYRCLFPEPPAAGTVPSCAEGGVLGALPGVVGSLQAVETLKLLLGAGEPLVGRLLVIDALTMRVQTVAVPRDPGCAACGDAARAGRGAEDWSVTQAMTGVGAAGCADARDAAATFGGPPPNTTMPRDAAHRPTAASRPSSRQRGHAPRAGAPSAEPARTLRLVRATPDAADPTSSVQRPTSDDAAPPPDMTPRALAEALQRGEPLVLVDVRELGEWHIARLPGATLIPLGNLHDGARDLDREADIVVYCHHGMRSAAAVGWLRRAGFLRVRNLAGGIDRWSIEVDPDVPRY